MTLTFDRGVEIETADSYELDRELQMTLEYIADNRRAYPSGNDPRFETVRAIIREQERRRLRAVPIRSMSNEDLDLALAESQQRMAQGIAKMRRLMGN